MSDPTILVSDSYDQTGEGGKEVLIEHQGVEVSLKIGAHPDDDEKGIAILDLIDDDVQTERIGEGSDWAGFEVRREGDDE